MTQAIDLKEKLSLFSDTWSPKIIAGMDGHDIRLAKIEGDFVFHNHADGDEVFLVVDGRFRMDFRDRSEWVEVGQMIVVPKGVDHKPFAPDVCSVLVMSRADADHTGGVDDPRRKEEFDRL